MFGNNYKSWYHKTLIFNKGISFYDTCMKVKKELELHNLNDDIKDVAKKVHTAKKGIFKKRYLVC